MPQRPLQRICNKRIGNHFFPGWVAGERFERIGYENVLFLRRRFKRCVWSECFFRRTHFSSGTRFDDCRFENCRFELAHTYMGGPSRFRDCQFTGCVFDGTQFSKSRFERCSFSGKLINVVFYGEDAPRGWRATLRDVDFTQAEFELVDFRMGIDLSSTRLPVGYVPPSIQH